MTSQPDSPPTTTASQDLRSHCDSLANSNANLDPCIVATQGAYLVPRRGTPVFEKAYDEQFAAELEMYLSALVTVQKSRNAKYHGAADEWPMGHTPPEFREQRAAELKLWDDLEGLSDVESDINDDEKEKDRNDTDAGVSQGKPVAAPDRPPRPQMPRQAESLPTPPLSADSPLNTSHMRKRQRISEEDDEEERPSKEHISPEEEVSAAAEVAVPNASQQKDRKRRRAFEVGDGEVDKERPSKVRVTTTRSATARQSSAWRGRLRLRNTRHTETQRFE